MLQMLFGDICFSNSNRTGDVLRYRSSALEKAPVAPSTVLVNSGGHGLRFSRRQMLQGRVEGTSSAPRLRSVWGTSLVRHPLYRRKMKECSGREQRNESAKPGLKPQAPPSEDTASTALRSSHHQHPPPEPSQRPLSPGKSHQPTQDPGSRNSCSPHADPSLCPGVGTGNGGSFQNSRSHPARMGEEAN